MSAQDNRYVADKVVAVVGNSSILYSDVYQAVQELLLQNRQQGVTSDRNPYCESLENLMMQRLLYHQAVVDSIDLQTNRIAMMVEEQITSELLRLGSIAELEKYYSKPIYIIRQELSANYTEMQGAIAMQQAVMDKVKITPGEVERYYRRLSEDEIPTIPAQYVFAQIVKIPAATEEAKMRARERLLELRQRIVDGANFAALAAVYSQDPESAKRGGEMDFMPKESFMRPFGEAMGRLQINQVSEIVETEYGFHIIQLLEKMGDQYRTRHILIKPQYTDEEVRATVAAVDSVLVKIHSGEMTFEQAATMYSDDKYSRQNNGIASNQPYLESLGQPSASLTSTRFFMEQMSADDAMYIRPMQVGDISSAYSTEDYRANIIVKTVMLKEVIPSHPATLKEDYKRIEAAALAEKQQEEFRKWMQGKIAGMYVRVDDDFKECEFEFPDFLK